MASDSKSWKSAPKTDMRQKQLSKYLLDCDWLTALTCNLIGWKQWTGTVGKLQETLYKRWFLVGWLVGKRRKTYYVHWCVTLLSEWRHCTTRWLCWAPTQPARYERGVLVTPASSSAVWSSSVLCEIAKSVLR